MVLLEDKAEQSYKLTTVHQLGGGRVEEEHWGGVGSV